MKKETDELTIVEKYQRDKSKSLAIRPYFDDKENMGLEKYGISLHDGVYHEEQLACLELNGIKRYVTGLNEFAPDVKLLPPGDRDIKVKEIRNVVSQLEKDLAANVIDPDDKEFWNKVKLLKPDNDKFWSRISLRCGNDPVFLDPIKDPYDLIKIYAINAGGFSIVGKSLKDVKKSTRKPKFYLDRQDDTASTRTETIKIRNKALVELQKMFDKNQTKLLYVAKVVDTNSTQYIKSTPNDIIYENMNDFIMGKGIEKNKKRAAESFVAAATETMEALKIRAIVKDAASYNFIVTKSNGSIETKDGGLKLGKRPAEVVAFLKDPLNEEVLFTLMGKVEEYWNS